MNDPDVAALIGKTFISRRDVIAQQHRNGSYTPVMEPLKMRHLRAHLDGSATYGHYVIDTDDRCKFFCFDLDLVEGWPTPDNPRAKEPLRWENGDTYRPVDVWRGEGDPYPYAGDIIACLQVELQSAAASLGEIIRDRLGIAVTVTYSGNKGIHVYGLTGHVEARKARRAALLLVEELGAWQPFRGQNFFRSSTWPSLTMEVFPKQDSLKGKDLGNLLRLPLGIHQKSQQEGFFLDCKDWTTWRPVDPVVAMTNGDPWS